MGLTNRKMVVSTSERRATRVIDPFRNTPVCVLKLASPNPSQIFPSGEHLIINCYLCTGKAQKHK